MLFIEIVMHILKYYRSLCDYIYLLYGLIIFGGNNQFKKE